MLSRDFFFFFKHVIAKAYGVHGGYLQLPTYYTLRGVLSGEEKRWSVEKPRAPPLTCAPREQASQRWGQMGGQDTTQRQRGKTDRKVDTTLPLATTRYFSCPEF